MIDTLGIIDRLPTELGARLEADEFFTDIPVIVAEEGNVLRELEQKQASMMQKSGKAGVAVIVMQILASDDFPNLQFGPLTLMPQFMVIENLDLNRSEAGTGKSARKIARRIRDVIKCFGAVGLVKNMQADKPCIEPARVSEDPADRVKAYQVNFRCLEVSTEDLSQVQIPQFISGAPAATFTITCATAGATIYYTTDDAYPGPAAGTVYSGAIAIPEGGVTVRACAYKAGSIASWVNRATITAEV